MENKSATGRKATYPVVIGELAMAETIAKSQVAETSELFEDVPTDVREVILSEARPRRFVCLELMVGAEDPIEKTFLLLRGCAKVIQQARGGEEVVLRIAAPGELLGKLGSKPGSTYSSTARAVQECEALMWTTETLEAAQMRFPILQRNVKNILRRRISEMEGRICRVSTQLASNRLASELVHLSNQIGQRVNSHVEIRITQDALAQMTSVNVFTLNRMLSGLETQGLLRIRRKCIEIHDSPGLSGLCV
jgi:CRP-like cAMP-binding protein